jgi:hypothetical protein
MDINKMNKYFKIGIFLMLGLSGSLQSRKSLSYFPDNQRRDNDSLQLIKDHEYHLSRTTLNYDSQSHTYQFTINIFIDDLTKCLEKQGHKNLNIGGKEASNTDAVIEAYLRTHLILMEEKAIPYTYLGREFSDDQIALYIYLESAESPARKNLAIKNSLLLEEFDDQKNIIDVTKDKKRVTQVLCEKGADYKAFSY